MQIFSISSLNILLAYLDRYRNIIVDTLEDCSLSQYKFDKKRLYDSNNNKIFKKYCIFAIACSIYILFVLKYNYK